MPNSDTSINASEAQNKGIGIVILIEDKDRIAPTEHATILSHQTGFPIAKRTERNKRAEGNKVNKKPTRQTTKHVKKQVEVDSTNEWQLVYTSDGLVLRLSNEPSWGDIIVDFNSAALNYRKQHGGGRNEALAKAIGIKGKDALSVIDCTAGMGSDSFVMASVGAHVTMLERSPVIAALLEDALYRISAEGLATQAQDHDVQALSKRLCLVKSDATSYLLAEGEKAKQESLADVIYLDPMFPHKKKSALVKKEMRAFQQLLGEDTDSAQLLEAALNYAGSRVVVKRPSYAEPIELSSGRKPNTAIESKKHRFDVYIQH